MIQGHLIADIMHFYDSLSTRSKSFYIKYVERLPEVVYLIKGTLLEKPIVALCRELFFLSILQALCKTVQLKIHNWDTLKDTCNAVTPK